ncbi:Uncharacterized protein FWK35_00018413, partial [Aphis craccivora]
MRNFALNFQLSINSSKKKTRFLITDYECIDFTMLCVFFWSSCSIPKLRVHIGAMNVLILQYCMVSGSKMNLVGALGGHFLNFPIVFKSAGKKPKKKKRASGFRSAVH